MRWIRIAALGLTLMHCGGGSSDWREIAARCATPRSGIDPFTGDRYPDKQATLNDEKSWLKAWTDDTYLWFSEVPSVNAAQYSTATDYFDQLRTRAKTPSGNDKDRFHFWMATADWEQLSNSGVEVGYGITLAALSTRPPRKYLVGYVEAASPAAGKLSRGAEIKAVDGVDLVNGSDINTLNAGLFPEAVGEQHTFSILDVGQTTPHDVVLQSAAVTSNPVPITGTIQTATGKVGYLLFNDHIATAEQKLVDAVGFLKSQGITDLVLDIRYNGGGYLAIASEVAYMIAGSARTSGKIFEELKFNDKHSSTDPVTGRQITPTPFYTQTLGFSAAEGTALPTLDLPRVFVLTGPGTCSASESVLNSLDGVGVQVIQIGATTCGKPYGFYPEDNCGTTYFSIQFKGVNAKGFGDYSDGFTPAPPASVAGFTGCTVADDFTHALSDSAEDRLATALNYSVTGTCGPTAAARALTARAGPRGDGAVLKSPWRQNRILTMPQTSR
jgi:carboxyl-terminal processing protease